MSSEIIIKQCIDCKTNKNINDFYKGKNTCKECRNIKYKCPHGKRKFYCRECGGNGYCEHGKDKRLCKEGCGGQAYCEHGNKKHVCKECNGKSLCEHNIRKYNCRECGGNSFCIHNKNKRYCKEGCGGQEYCEHGKQKRKCREGCGGQAYCEHGKDKRRCKQGCGGQSYCEHGKDKSRCREGCGGQAYCEHGKDKSRCKECGGIAFCIHNKQKRQCIECNPLISCQLCKNIYVDKRTKFYPLCEACFSFTYPDSKLVTAYKIKERYLCDELKEKFKDIDISLTLDKRVDGGCSSRRPDVFIDVLTHSIIIECDEYQHKNYECENKRTMELFRDLGNRPLVLIRFNPDGYIRKNKEREKGCFTPLIDIEDIHRKKFYNIVKEEWNRRIETLIPIVKEYTELGTFPDKEITIIHLFYNNFD